MSFREAEHAGWTARATSYDATLVAVTGRGGRQPVVAHQAEAARDAPDNLAVGSLRRLSIKRGGLLGCVEGLEYQPLGDRRVGASRRQRVRRGGGWRRCRARARQRCRDLGCLMRAAYLVPDQRPEVGDGAMA
jgi:hypothetical protein